MIPEEVAHRQYHNAADRAERNAPRKSDLAAARHDMAESIVTGKTVAGLDLAAVLDCELNENPRFSTELAAALNPWHVDEGGRHVTGAEYWLEMVSFLEALAAKHLPEDAVEEFAAEIARDLGME